jgi:hypothetical protein
VQETLQLEQILGKQLQPIQSFISDVDTVRLQLASAVDTVGFQLAKAVEAAQSHERRSRLAQVAIALFDTLAGGFLALSVYFFIQGNYSPAIGLLGPGVAAGFGAVAFRSRKILIEHIRQ